MAFTLVLMHSRNDKLSTLYSIPFFEGMVKKIISVLDFSDQFFGQIT